jgi:hypothetical protein
MKIGYDVRNDFKMLSAVNKEWENLKEKSRVILDLRSLQAEIAKRNGTFFPSTSDFSSERGLSEVMQRYLQEFKMC